MSIFSDLVEEVMEIFMDYFSVYGSSFESCLENLETVFKRCNVKNLTLHWEQFHFMVTEDIVLGHKISTACLEVDQAKISLIKILIPPTIVKGIGVFFGMQDFTEGLSKTSQKLQDHYADFWRRMQILNLMKHAFLRLRKSNLNWSYHPSWLHQTREKTLKLCVMSVTM